MKDHIIAVLVSFVLIVALQSDGLAGTKACGSRDTACKEFAALAKAGQYGKIVEKVKPKQTYSEAARDIIGHAYLMTATREGTPPEQEERFCRKALEYGATQAYMSLYFIHAQTDTAKANELLKQYVATKPQDSAPYMLLGEADFNQGNFRSAREYLKEARKVSKEKSGSLDWLLFKASYLTGDYVAASEMLDSSFSHGKTVGDLKALVASDPRFADMGKQEAFRKFYTILNGRDMARM